MSHVRLNQLRHLLRDERGLALPFALGVTVVLSALSAGVISYVSTNQSANERSRADQKAYGLAEAGVSYAFSTLAKAVDDDPYTAPSGSAVPPTTVTLPGGSVTYEGTLSGSTWTLTATSTVANPTGPSAASVQRTASIQATVNMVTSGDTRPYDYLFIDQPSGCFTLQNTVTIEIPLYVRGDLCLENNTIIQAPAVHVLGNVHVNSPQASVGTSTTPIPDFSITGDCYREGALTACSASSTSRVWAAGYGTNPPVIDKPEVDLADAYANADLGPMSNCTAGYGTASFPGGFDNDTTLNASRGNVELTPSTGYDCQKVVGGEVVAQIKWVPGATPSSTGRLFVKGTIFFDGNLTWSNLNKIDYDGQATIYASGKLIIKNQADLCGVEACDETWVPEDDFITFVAGSMKSETTTDPLSGDVGQKVQFQGAILCVNDYDQDNNTVIWGPVIARNATITNSGTFKALPDSWGDGPPGLPMSETTTAQLQPVTGSYSG